MKTHEGARRAGGCVDSWWSTSWSNATSPQYAAQLSRHASPTDPFAAMRTRRLSTAARERGIGRCGARFLVTSRAAWLWREDTQPTVSGDHALATFNGERCPELIPGRRGPRRASNVMTGRAVLLDKPEIDALWPRRTARPNKAVGITACCCSLHTARAQRGPAVAVRDLDVRSDGSGSVRLVGKGGKTRHCPLWPHMTSLRR